MQWQNLYIPVDQLVPMLILLHKADQQMDVLKWQNQHVLAVRLVFLHLPSFCAQMVQLLILTAIALKHFYISN